MSNLLSLEKISKSYNGKQVLNEISFQVEEGSFVSIFGPNASGKTTIFNIISGLVLPDSGAIHWEHGKPAIAYVFQNYRDTLLPWKNIWENISLPLKLKGIGAAERKIRSSDLLKRFALDIDINKFPYELSGGQQQMIAILRAVITNPELLLLDEPFSALDFQRRLELQQKILEIWKETKTTIVFITHDLDEAIYLSDDVVLIGKKPTVIIDNQKIEMDRPRSISVLTSNSFMDYRKALLKWYI